MFIFITPLNLSFSVPDKNNILFKNDCCIEDKKIESADVRISQIVQRRQTKCFCCSKRNMKDIQGDPQKVYKFVSKPLINDKLKDTCGSRCMNFITSSSNLAIHISI